MMMSRLSALKMGNEEPSQEAQYRYILRGPRDLVKEVIEQKELCITAEEPILAETLFSTISKGTELSAWKGLPPIRDGIKKYPRLMGYCNVARIVEVDSERTGYRVGDIILTGREHCTAFRSSDAGIFLKVPRSEKEGCEIYSGLYLSHIAYDSLQRGDYRPGHKVAIIGLGVLGYLVGALVRQFGGVASCYTSRSKMVADGAASVIRLVPKFAENKILGEEEFDIVVNTSDAWDDYRLALILARKGGRIINIGFPGRGIRTPEWNPLEPRYLYSKQLSIAYSGYTPDVDCDPIDIRFTKKRNLKFLAELVEAGNSCLEHIYRERVPASELGRVYSELESSKDFGTVMLRWKT